MRHTVHCHHNRRARICGASQGDAIRPFDKVDDPVGFQPGCIHSHRHFGVDLNGTAGRGGIARLIRGDRSDGRVISARRDFGRGEPDAPGAACCCDHGMADAAHGDDNAGARLGCTGDRNPGGVFGCIDHAVAADGGGDKGDAGVGIHRKAATDGGGIAVVVNSIDRHSLFIFASR